MEIRSHQDFQYIRSLRGNALDRRGELGLFRRRGFEGVEAAGAWQGSLPNSGIHRRELAEVPRSAPGIVRRQSQMEHRTEWDEQAGILQAP